MSSFAIFIILTSLIGPSIICTFFSLYHFIRSPQLRKKPRNCLVFCLLIMNFVQEIIELPPRLYFLYTRQIMFPNPNFCNFFNWCQFTLVTINLLMIALGSIERYLLIFNHILLSHHVILLRYIPLLLCILFPTIFYSIGIYGIQCTTTYNYNSVSCGLPCFFFISSFAVIFKNIIMICVPVIFTILMSSLLIIRVYIQRRKMQRRRNFWKENIQMIIQLIPIIILYLIIWIPLSILFFFSTFGTITQKAIVTPLINDYLGNLKYLVNLIYPFLVPFGQPELRRKIKRIFRCCYLHQEQTAITVIPLRSILNNNVMPSSHPHN